MQWEGGVSEMNASGSIDMKTQRQCSDPEEVLDIFWKTSWLDLVSWGET